MARFSVVKTVIGGGPRAAKAVAVLTQLLMWFAMSPNAVAHADDPSWLNQQVVDGPFKFGGFFVGMSENPDDGSTQAQGQFLYLGFAVENVTTLPKTYFASYQMVADDMGRVFAPNTSVALLENRDEPIVGINPGNKLHTSLAFDVPVGTASSDYVLVLRATAESAGVSVRLPAGRKVKELPPPTQAEIDDFARRNGLLVPSPPTNSVPYIPLSPYPAR